MPTPTYKPLANLTLSSSSASVTFSSISQAYKDLVLVCNLAATVAGGTVRMRFNYDTGNNYSAVYAYGNGSSAGGGSSANAFANVNTGMTTLTMSPQHLLTVSIFNYTGRGGTHAPVISRLSQPSNGVEMSAVRWASDADITVVEVYTASNAFAAGSTFSLYGIAA